MPDQLQSHSAAGASPEPLQLGPARFRPELVMRSGLQFAKMRAEGRTRAGRHVVLSWLDAPDGREQLGLICGRRYDHKAVERNRARRLMREAYRLLRPGLSRPLWMVLIARPSLHGRALHHVQRDLLSLWRGEGLMT